MLRKKAKYGAKTSHSHGNFISKVIDLFVTEILRKNVRQRRDTMFQKGGYS